MNYSAEIIGGVLLGLASAIPLIFEGKICGVSGFASAALKPSKPEGKIGLIFVLGLVIAGAIWRFSGGDLPFLYVNRANYWLWALAGMLVGFGTRYGGGCTSGHGICGMGRLSRRSIAAVGIFMGVAIITTLLMRGFA